MPCADRLAHRTAARVAALPGWVLIALSLAGCSGLSERQIAPAPTDDMALLASRSGCLACHALNAGVPGPNALPPIGPSWPQVARRYRSEAAGAQRDALIDRLIRTVQDGTNPYTSRWKGQISGLAMPPNATAISPSDSRRLIEWILRQP
jgi:cytochrome c